MHHKESLVVFFAISSRAKVPAKTPPGTIVSNEGLVRKNSATTYPYSVKGKYLALKETIVLSMSLLSRRRPPDPNQSASSGD
jgi:hypothetical protein